MGFDRLEWANCPADCPATRPSGNCRWTKLRAPIGDELDASMKKSRLSDEQIIGFLKQAEGGTSVHELCRKIGVNPMVSNPANPEPVRLPVA